VLVARTDVGETTFGRRRCGSLLGMATPPVTPAVEWAWQRQSVWSQAADRLKAEQRRARALRLALTVAGAAATMASSQLTPTHEAVGVSLAVLAAAVLVGVGILGGRQSVEQVRRWTRARSVSEALKTEVHLYLTRAGDYARQDPEGRLDAEVQRIEGEAGDLQSRTGGLQPSARPMPPVHDVDSYLDVRVRQSQLAKYYEPKAAELRTRLRIAKAVEVALALVAAGLAAVNAVSPDVGAWATVVTTAAGAVAAHVAGQRYEFLWIEYSRTASELRRLAARRSAADGRPLSGPELIAACEQVISVQNQAWMAKWGEEQDKVEQQS
jgi:conflict system pore-forming effector with SLATT domain/uncharacterized protein DUF4231